ncbi:MAG: RHS repeat-associated core domain-containing protein [Bacteroidetes bacterium]|nr:RHS repeat-associated core domain-containing protein [Bacteroidota bacterium]
MIQKHNISDYSNFYSIAYRFGFNGKEKDNEVKGTGNSLDFGARIYDPRIGRWLSVDPLAKKFPEESPFLYAGNNPIFLTDPDGMEPIKPQAGSVSGFVAFLNNTRTKMGTLTGALAQDAMLRLGRTEMNWKQKRPTPATTAPFNNIKDRYIYTEKGGWIDMAHFLFYAGKAYEYKQNKISAENMIKSETFVFLSPESQMYYIQQAGINPVSEAIQDGYKQEMSDRLFAPYSAYSYEDLPSDKYGADFAVNYFNPNSKLSFGEQLGNYMNNQLKATSPENAPNYECLPDSEPTDKPTGTNHTVNAKTPDCYE